MIDQKIKNNIAFDKICNYPIFNTFVRLFYYPIFFYRTIHKNSDFNKSLCTYNNFFFSGKYL